MGVLIVGIACCYGEVAAVICLLGRFYREGCPPRPAFRALDRAEWISFPIFSIFSIPFASTRGWYTEIIRWTIA